MLGTFTYKIIYKTYYFPCIYKTDMQCFAQGYTATGDETGRYLSIFMFAVTKCMKLGLL